MGKHEGTSIMNIKFCTGGKHENTGITNIKLCTVGKHECTDMQNNISNIRTLLYKSYARMQR